MNQYRIENQWDRIQEDVKQRWPRLTDEDLEEIRGDRKKLIGKIRTRYDRTQPAALEDVIEFEVQIARTR